MELKAAHSFKTKAFNNNIIYNSVIPKLVRLLAYAQQSRNYVSSLAF